MADIFYVEEGYVDRGYAVYTADAVVSSRDERTLTPSGNVSTSTAQYNVGSASIAFDGNGDYLSIDSSPITSSGDWGVETWIRLSNTTGTKTIFNFLSGTTGVPGVKLDLNGAALRLTVSIDGTSADILTQVGSLSSNTWYHVALLKSGGNFRVLQNNSQIININLSTGVTIYNGANNIIGASYSAGSPTNYFNGYMDEFRVSSTNRSNYSTTANANDRLTTLLIHGEGGLVDDASGGIVAKASITVASLKLIFGSATLNSVATVNAIGERLTASATLNAVATLTASPTIVQFGVATLSAQFGIQIDTIRTRGTITILASSGVMSARGNAIFRIGAPSDIPGMYGLRHTSGLKLDPNYFVDYQFHDFWSDSTTTTPNYSASVSNGTWGDTKIISIWAKIDNGTGIILGWGNFLGEEADLGAGSITTYYSKFSINAGNAELYWIQDHLGAADPGPNETYTLSWSGLTSDSNWHHYLLRKTTGGTELYQDGVSKGNSATNPNWVTALGIINLGHLKQYNGRRDQANISTGALAQLWGSPDYSGFNVSDFYNSGFVDLETNTNLPGATFYNLLDWEFNERGLEFNNPPTYFVPSPKIICYRWTGTGKEDGVRLTSVTGTGAEKSLFSSGNYDNEKIIDAVATITVDAISTFGGRATLASVATLQAEGDKNVVASATLNAQATLTVNADVQSGGLAGIVAVAGLSTKGNATFSQRATLNAQANITQASSTYAFFGEANLSSSASLRVVTSAEATLNSTATLTVDPTFNFGAKSSLLVTATIFAQGESSKLARATIGAQASLTGKLTIVPIPDDLMTIFVEADLRIVDVPFDTRITTIEAESNLNRILSETRNILVDIESRQLREAVDPALEVTTARIRRIPA